MTLLKQEFQKHVKKINNNDFIYKHKIAFYLLSEQPFFDSFVQVKIFKNPMRQ